MSKGVDEMSQDEYRKAAIDAVKKLSVDVGIQTKLEAIKKISVPGQNPHMQTHAHRETRKMQA